MVRDLQIKQMMIGALFAGIFLLTGAIAVEGYRLGVFLRGLH